MSNPGERHLLHLFGHGHRPFDAFGTTQRFVRSDIDRTRLRRGIAISLLKAHHPNLPQDSDSLDRIEDLTVRIASYQGYKSVVDYTTVR